MKKHWSVGGVVVVACPRCGLPLHRVKAGKVGGLRCGRVLCGIGKVKR